MTIKFVHTNIVAKDWRKLADFYINALGCTEKKPERDLSGKWLDDVTSLSNTHIRGIHLYLPGFEANGPTLEIFEYEENIQTASKQTNTEGFSHIAFAVDNVDECIQSIIKNGGGLVGKIVKQEIAGVGSIYFAYAKDPEGNIIEIQKWN